jgi:N-acetyl-anhydromuramyl-L-alanine amidase AmpD
VLPANNELPKNVRDVDNFHQARGFEITCMGHVYHIAYHYLILPNGAVKAGRPEKCQGAHAKGYNSYVGIAVVGDFTGKDSAGKNGPIVPTNQQIKSLVQLCRRLRDRYSIPLQHIVRHGDISSTDCPGRRFPFQHVLQQLAQQPEPAAGPKG